MKLPIGPLARLALRFALKRLAEAINDPAKPAVTRESAKDALVRELQDAAMRELGKRVAR